MKIDELDKIITTSGGLIPLNRRLPPSPSICFPYTPRPLEEEKGEDIGITFRKRLSADGHLGAVER